MGALRRAVEPLRGTQLSGGGGQGSDEDRSPVWERGRTIGWTSPPTPPTHTLLPTITGHQDWASAAARTSLGRATARGLLSTHSGCCALLSSTSQRNLPRAPVGCLPLPPSPRHFPRHLHPSNLHFQRSSHPACTPVHFLNSLHCGSLAGYFQFHQLSKIISTHSFIPSTFA